MIKRLAVRLVLVGFLLITVPAITTTFSVQAGYTTTGGYCQCGCPGCLCYPEELPEMCINSATPAPDSDKPAKGNVDLGSLGLMGLAIIFAMLRRFGA